MTVDRKQLVREYKQSIPTGGVFQIRNLQNGRSFISVNANLTAAMNSQRWQLDLGMHPNRPLQKDWKESGEKSFVFEVLNTLAPPEQGEYDPTDDLRALEQLWLERAASSGQDGYNQ